MAEEPLSYPDEIWKVVTDPRFGEPLEASDYGRVRRMGHRYLRNGRPGVAPFWSTKKARIAHVFFLSGYLTATIKYACGTRFSCPNHILVCCAFHGDRPTAQHDVAHWDGIRENCTPDNLRWATAKENEDDKARHGRRVKGVDCHLAKLTDDLVRQMRADFNGNYAASARVFGVTRPVAAAAIKRRNWKHVT